MRILSFDIGGTKISFALMNEKGEFLNEITSLPTPRDAASIANIFQKNFAQLSPDGVAIATAGIVYQNNLQGKPNNLPDGYEAIDFHRIFSVPFIIENDANAAAWAEYQAGTLQNVSNGIVLTLGTDVGCSIIVNNQLLRGKCGAAGEIRMDFSGSSLKNLAQKANLSTLDCFEIQQQAIHGNLAAEQVYKQWEKNLLDGLHRLNNLLDTEIIALSGSLSKIVDYNYINTTLKTSCPLNYPLVVPAKFSTNAGLVGAAFLWQKQFKESVL